MRVDGGGLGGALGVSALFEYAREIRVYLGADSRLLRVALAPAVFFWWLWRRCWRTSLRNECSPADCLCAQAEGLVLNMYGGFVLRVVKIVRRTVPALGPAYLRFA